MLRVMTNCPPTNQILYSHRVGLRLGEVLELHVNVHVAL